jgi:U3 small nucleolar RNA-associated protein 3
MALDQKRKADYKILANKGLTPYRKKEVRNPRVKRRLKYEKAKKKLGSIRMLAVDKKTLGNYHGESTGIKSDISKSTKFQ